MERFKEGLEVFSVYYRMLVCITFGLGIVLLPIAIPIVLICSIVYALK